jgi:cytochrome c oxidase cbb3-type subunit I
LAQLGRTALGSERLLVTAGAFWNFGLLLGICGILAGDGNAVRGLEFPGAAAAVLLVAYVCIGVWSLILLRDRSRDGLYVSQWYLLAAFLCFPWLYATANMLLIWYPVQGSAQGPIASWFFGARRSFLGPFTISFRTLRSGPCEPIPRVCWRFGFLPFLAAGWA